MSETLDFCMPDGLAEHACELERFWPGMLADLRASHVPLNEGGDPAADVGDPDPGPDTESGEPRADGDPAPDPALEPAPVPQVAEPDWNDINTLRAAYAALQERGAIPTEAAQTSPVAEPQAPTFVDEYGNVDQQALQEFLDYRDQQRLGPIENFIMQLQQAEVERQTAGMVAELVTESGLNLDEDGVQALRAAAFMLGGRAGVNDQRQAVKLAIDWLAGERKAARDAGVKAYQESIGQVAATPGEPSASGNGTLIEPRPRTYDEIIARQAARLSA